MDKLAYLILSGLGVLALTFITLYLKRISEDSTENRASINSVSANVGRIHNQIIAEFVTKGEFAPLRNRVDDLQRDVTELQVHVGIDIRR